MPGPGKDLALVCFLRHGVTATPDSFRNAGLNRSNPLQEAKSTSRSQIQMDEAAIRAADSYNGLEVIQHSPLKVARRQTGTLRNRLRHRQRRRIVEERFRDQTLAIMRKARITVQETFNLAPGRCVVRIVVRYGDGKAMATRNKGIQIQ